MNINFAPMDENYIKQMVEAGYYSNATELVRDAVRRMRERSSVNPRLMAAIQKGADDIAAGRVVAYDEHFWENTRARALQLAESNAAFDPDVIPHDFKP